MLNDAEMEQYAERYETYISVEVGFMEWMREIAVNKVRLLLSDLIEIEPYRQRKSDTIFYAHSRHTTCAWIELTKGRSGSAEN